ncbi:MAG: heme-binding domain-containing protein [Ferruginibacter sp.]
MKKFFKILLISLLVIFILAQFFPKPVANDSGVFNQPIQSVHVVPPAADSIIKTSCYNCHSNKTDYPWYSNIQPVAWWLGDHIAEGKSQLNFSVFGTYPIGKQYKKLEEVIDEVKSGDMPLESYTIIHRYAILNDTQKATLTSWASALRDSIKSAYPADSLKRKGRSQSPPKS